MKEPCENDERLIEGIKEGDYISYNKLFICYYGRLCQYVYGMIANRNNAEDIVQELFLHIWENRKKLDIHDHVSGYLYRMAKNRTLNYLRETTNHRVVLEKQETKLPYYEDNSLETDEFRIALYDCMNRLPARCREVLLLHRVKGLKQKEIAEKLNITIKTIKNQIWISLQKMKVCLELKGV